EGYELIASPLILSKTVTTVKFHNVTPWRGSQLKDLKNFASPGFRVSGYLIKGNDFVGPFDTTDKDGLKIIYTSDFYDSGKRYILNPFAVSVGITRAVILEAFNVYDCLFQKVYNIEPEDLKITASEDCLSYLDQRFPNIYFTIENVNDFDLDDPSGNITEQGAEGLFAYILATGGGIKYHAVVVRGKIRYVLQVNSDDTVFRWTWPGDILLHGPPLPIGTALLIDQSIKFVNNVITTNVTWDGGEPIYYDVLNNNIVDKDDILLYGRAAALGSCLIRDGNLRFADNPNFVGDTRYGPRRLNFWDYGEPIYWSTNNVIDVDNDNVYDRGDTGVNPATPEDGGVLTDSNGNGIPDPNEKISGASGNFYVLTYPFPSRIQRDGKIYAMIKPATKECSDINITIFTNYVMYNFLGPRPPTYILEQDRYPLNDSGLPGPQALDHGLVDYKGTLKPPIRTEKIYDLNFAEFDVVDEALEHSIFSNPYPPYGPAANQDPWVLKNLIMELRCYPGGQTNLPGSGWGYDYRKLPDLGPANAFAVVGLTNGWNARHAQIRDMLWKLGTEYYPLTDYTFRFIAKLKNGTHVIPDYIEIVGEKASTEGQPVFMVGPYDGNYTYTPTGVSGLPKNYKYYNNWLDSPLEVTTIPDKPGMYVKDGYLFEDGWTLNDVVEVKGIIPTGPGYITINIYYGDYVTTYKYCTSCMDTPAKIPVHAIELVPDKSSLEVDSDNLLKVTAKIYPFDKETAPYGEVTNPIQPLASQSLIFVWQDRGVLDPVKPVLGIRHGVGDGWITGQQPKFGGSPIDTLSGTVYNAGPVYNAKDINLDGFITFKDLETEIVGSYNVATNTWNGGFVYMTSITSLIGQGEYNFNLASTYNSQLNEIGFDFDENGIILSNEVIPVRVTAYSYGDDGVNPRVATGTGGNGWEPWEVYLAGQVELPVVGQPDWGVEPSPCLTAGVLPEAQPDGKPLTFIVTDADGNPVNLSIGVGGKEVNDTLIWYGLFNDVVPSLLPSFYWVRTDLHNTSIFEDPDTGASFALSEHLKAANDMYSPTFEPIEIDFDEKVDGIYKFNGFVANDKGEFEIRVYSPDRKHYGVEKVVVELPKIKYDIVNLDDESGTVHTVPGDPDFVMTAGDLRTYKVTVTITDCEDKPIGGSGKPVEECAPEEEGLYAGFLPFVAYTPHYFLWLGYDANEDSDIYGGEWDAFDVYANTWTFPAEEGAIGNYIRPPHQPTLVAYRYGYGDYDAVGNFHGLDQAIFNNEYNYDKWEWGQLYPDRNGDCVIDVDDTLPLDENGQVTFYIETDDISVLAGIAGKNPYVFTAGDVAGWPEYMDLPRTRFGPLGEDFGFYLDWYGNVDKTVDIKLMMFKILNGETHLELGKDIFSTNNYDLTYGLENHIVVQALPADDRDLAVREGVQVQLVGNVETWSYGTLMHNDEGVAETTLNFKPRGVGARIAYLAVVTQWSTDIFWDHWYAESKMWYYNWFNLRVKPWFVDFTSPGEPVYWTYDNRGPDETIDYKCLSENLQIYLENPELYVEELAAYLLIYFEDIDWMYGDDYSETDALFFGDIWGFEFWAGFLGYLTGTLDVGQIIEGNLFSPYGHDIENQRKLTQIAPPVGFGAYDVPYFDAGKGLALTLKGDLTVGVETEVTVKVTEAGPNFPVAGAEVTLYGAGVDLSGVTDADGVAKFLVKPTEAGEILITVAKDGYVPGKTVVVVGADTIAPELSVDKPVSPTNNPTLTITGIATDNAGVPTVLVNGVEATVDADGKFSAEVTLKEGENDIVVVAKDKSGNKTEKLLKVVLDTLPPNVTVNALPSPLTSTKVKLTGYVEIGSTVLVNDKPATVASDDWEVELTLDYGENLVTVVAKDSVGNEKKVETTVVIFKETLLELQIGSPTPKVNGVYGDPLEAAPFIKDGRTMVPLRFIAEAFGANVEWIPETKGINISLELASAVHTIGLQVGNPTAIVDGEVVTLDVAPVIVNGRTFVPIRFIAESFGATVDWNDLYQVVTIDFLWY
ncbi:MAG TPA: stalk domain-containing protein, partial [Caldisericia bacterium]|nr:stalk domain-containing protein [Caldisericia bacterium]